MTEEMLSGFEVRSPSRSSFPRKRRHVLLSTSRLPRQVVVFTEISNEDAIRFCDYCHSHSPPIAFIKAETRGLFASAFCDFGPNFTVLDVDGERRALGPRLLATGG